MGRGLIPWGRVRVGAAMGALLGVVGLAGEAQAQSASPGASAPSDGEIIITARRRDEALGRAGAPVSALSGEALVETGTSQVEKLNERFPALTVQPTATGNLIFIRGVGNFALLPNSDPAVGFAFDGVFVSRPMGTMSQFFDLERVELLKGPQGVLYGRNASAGSVNLEPRQPVIGRSSAQVHLTGASHSNELGEAAVNMPLGRGAALRLSAAMSEQGPLLAGYRKGPEQHSARAQLKALLGDRVTLRLAADYNHIGGVGIGSSYLGNYVYVPAQGGYRFIDANLPLSEGLYSPEAQAFRQTIFLGSAGRQLDAIGSRPRQNHQFYGAHARADIDLGFAELTLIPAWRKSKIDAIVSGSPFGYGQLEEDEQTSVEARLAGRQGRFEWLAGAFLFDESIDADTTTNLASSLSVTTALYETRSRALFGNATFHVSRALRISGGLRWTRDRRNYVSEGETLSIQCQVRVDNRPSCPAVPLFPLVANFGEVPFPVPDTAGGRLPILVEGVPTGAVVARSASSSDGRLTDRAVTWRVGGEADLGPRTLAYASAETGYRPGGFSSGVGFETYDPERVTAFTLGLRHRLADRLQVDLEAFWWNYRDQQVSSLRPDLSPERRNAFITDNIASSRIRGVEAELRYQPWRGTRLGGIVQYLDADYRSFEYIQANTGVPPLTGCDAALDAAANLYTVDCGGKQPYNSPRWSMSLNGLHTVPLGPLTLTLAADTHYRSARNVGFAFLAQQRIGATWTSNGQLILGIPRHRLDIAAFVRNIEGERVPLFSNFHPVSNALIVVTTPPRQWGLRASWRL